MKFGLFGCGDDSEHNGVRLVERPPMSDQPATGDHFLMVGALFDCVKYISNQRPPPMKRQSLASGFMAPKKSAIHDNIFPS